MEQQKPTMYITVLLSITAGYCDTVTFVSADKLFSAHVTGNFIVLAYDIVNHADTSGWLKLLSFPVFIVAVMTGGVIAANSIKPCTLLLVEGVLLSISGVIWMLFSATGVNSQGWTSYFVAMCIVFAMGLQNAFGKIFSKETYGPTTMMTGNVTQAALDMGKLLKSSTSDITITRISLQRQAVTIFGFLAGCLFGGILGKTIGLSSVLLPGIAVIIYAMTTMAKQTGAAVQL